MDPETAWLDAWLGVCEAVGDAEGAGGWRPDSAALLQKAERALAAFRSVAGAEDAPLLADLDARMEAVRAELKTAQADAAWRASEEGQRALAAQAVEEQRAEWAEQGGAPPAGWRA